MGSLRKDPGAAAGSALRSFETSPRGGGSLTRGSEAATPAAPCRREGAGGALTRVPPTDCPWLCGAGSVSCVLACGLVWAGGGLRLGMGGGPGNVAAAVAPAGLASDEGWRGGCFTMAFGAVPFRRLCKLDEAPGAPSKGASGMALSVTAPAGYHRSTVEEITWTKRSTFSRSAAAARRSAAAAARSAARMALSDASLA